jgi:hypothetical protein
MVMITHCCKKKDEKKKKLDFFISKVSTDQESLSSGSNIKPIIKTDCSNNENYIFGNKIMYIQKGY